MSNYQRLISYIYTYEGGIKGKNIGFAKVDARGSQCRITANVKKIFVGGNPMGVYLLSVQKEIKIGTLFARNGAGEFRTVVNASNVEGSGLGMDQFYGLSIHDVESAWRSYTTIWEDAVAHAAEIELADVTAEKVSEKQIQKDGIKKEQEQLPISKEIEAQLKLEKEIEAGQAEEAAVKTGLSPIVMKQNQDMNVHENGIRENLDRGNRPKQLKETAMPQEIMLEQEPPPLELNQSGKDSLLQEERTVKPWKDEARGIRERLMQAQLLPNAEPVQKERNEPQEPLQVPNEPENVFLEESRKAPEESGAEPEIQAVEASAGQEAETVIQEELPSDTVPVLCEDRECYFHGELWERFRKKYAKIMAFDYADGCEILTIKPQDIGLLPRDTWVYGNNSFLLHGYYNFRYLILARLNNPSGPARYLLGIPGHYYSNEKYMATMFGFPNFVLAKKQPSTDGRFGYWYTDIKMGE